MATLKLAIDARDLRREIEAVKRDLAKLKEATTGAVKSTGELDKAQQSSGKTAAFLSGHLRTLFGIVAGYLTIRRAVTVLRDFETGLVGVAKTSDLAGSELDGLAASVIEMSLRMPSGTKELLAIAQAAGQLGVKGADNILAFTETIAKLGSATNLQGEEAATTLARILNVMGEAPAQVRILGSVITALGNNFAATESEIARHANQVALATSVYAIGSTRAAAFGVTMAALGVRAELSGSSIGRMFRSIDAAIRDGGQALQSLTILTNTSASEISRLFKDDPTAVVVRFLEGLRGVIREGGSAAKVLEVFGLEGEEVLKVIPSLANNIDQLSNALRLANKEQTDTNALNEEVARANVTLAARWKILGNTIDAVILKYREATGPLAGLVTTLADAVRILFDLDRNLSSSSREAEAFAEVFKGIGTVVLFVFQQINNVVTFIRLAINGLVAGFQLASSAIEIVVEEVEILLKSKFPAAFDAIPDAVIRAMQFSGNALLDTFGGILERLKGMKIGDALARDAQLAAETGITDTSDRISARLGAAYQAIKEENNKGYDSIIDQAAAIQSALDTLGNLKIGGGRSAAVPSNANPLDVVSQAQSTFGVSAPPTSAPFAAAAASIRNYSDAIGEATSKSSDFESTQERAQRFLQAFKTDQDAVNEAFVEGNDLYQRGAISASEYKNAVKQIREEQERVNEQLLRQSTTVNAGVQRFWDDYKTAATDAASAVERVLGTAFGASENALGDFLTGAKNGDEIIRDFGNSVVREISRIISRLIIMVALEGLSSLFAPSSAPTRSTVGTFSSPNGFVDSFADSSGLILPTGASGGTFRGPRSGYLAVLHGTERVEPLNPVTKEPLNAGSSGSQGNVTIIQEISINTIDAKSFDERAIESLSRNLETHGMAIAGEFNRNPSLRDRFISRRA